MNRILRKIILGYSNPQKYLGVRLKDNEVKERVIITHNGNVTDITANHSIVCEKPFCVAIMLPKEREGEVAADTVEMSILRNNKICTALQLALKDKIWENNTVVFIFEIKEAISYQISQFRQRILMRYFLREKKLTLLEGSIYAALYSYPRKVIIISYEDGNYYNLFPMDFRRYYAADNLYVFGLRVSNITLDKILQSKKLVVCDTDTVALNTIYFLGKHHSSSPPEKADLPFELAQSELYKFPVPAFSASYKEVEIINSKKIGSHMLMIGRAINQVQVRPESDSIYHIHFFEYIKAYKPAF